MYLLFFIFHLIPDYNTLISHAHMILAVSFAEFWWLVVDDGVPYIWLTILSQVQNNYYSRLIFLL